MGPTRPEEVVIRLRSHARMLALPVLLILALAGAVPYLGPRLDEEWQQWALYGGAGVLFLVAVVWPFAVWAGRSYTITTRRVVLKSGVLVRNRQELLHARDNDIRLRASGLQLVFGSGDIVIDSGSARPAVLRDVPRAGLVQSALVELAEASRNPVVGWRQRTGEIP